MEQQKNLGATLGAIEKIQFINIHQYQQIIFIVRLTPPHHQFSRQQPFESRKSCWFQRTFGISFFSSLLKARAERMENRSKKRDDATLENRAARKGNGDGEIVLTGVGFRRVGLCSGVCRFASTDTLSISGR